MKSNTDIHLTEVYASDPIRASMVKDLLENEGIIAFLKDDFIGTLVPWHAAPAGYKPVKVFVSGSDLKAAAKVVAGFENRSEEPVE